MELTGQSLQFPILLESGTPVYITGKDLIEQAAFDVLTAESPRFFLGEYKNRLKELKFKQNDKVLLSLLSIFISDALKKWETRITIKGIQFQQGQDYIDCRIAYIIKGTKDVNTFVYPFYNKITY